MSRLVDKLAILLICVLGCAMANSITAPVAALLIEVGASLMVQYFTGTKAGACIIAVSACLCGVFPIFFCMAPLMLYDALWEKKWWLVLPSFSALVNIDRLSSTQIILTAAGIMMTALIYVRVSKLENTVSALTALRDKVEEKNLLLGDKNKRLLEAQDNEIHLATLKERNRIAREIHDNVGHMLTRSLLQAGALIIINKDENLNEPLNDLKETLNSAMTSIRQSVHDLHDESIDLRVVIDESIRSVEDRFKVELDYDVSRDMPVKVKLCFIGIIKEGLSNAVKHSKGDRIRIAVREHPGFYQLTVEDNGSCSDIKESGIGISNMRERAESINGMISFTPSEKGFRIFLSVKK